MPNSAIETNYSNTICVDSDYFTFIDSDSLTIDEQKLKGLMPFELVPIHTLTKQDFELLLKFFFDVGGAFPKNFRKDDGLLYKFIVISGKRFQKVQEFIVEHNLQKFELLLITILSLGSKAELDNTIHKSEKEKQGGKVKTDRFDQRVASEKIAFQGKKGIQKIEELFKLVNDNPDYEGMFNEVCHFLSS